MDVGLRGIKDDRNNSVFQILGFEKGRTLAVTASPSAATILQKRGDLDYAAFELTAKGTDIYVRFGLSDVTVGTANDAWDFIILDGQWRTVPRMGATHLRAVGVGAGQLFYSGRI